MSPEQALMSRLDQDQVERSKAEIEPTLYELYNDFVNDFVTKFLRSIEQVPINRRSVKIDLRSQKISNVFDYDENEGMPPQRFIITTPLNTPLPDNVRPLLQTAWTEFEIADPSADPENDPSAFFKVKIGAGGERQVEFYDVDATRGRGSVSLSEPDKLPPLSKISNALEILGVEEGFLP